ncbi:HicA-related toxin-antitoxin protein [Betaproteobacteria bacterium]|nr:HicA-related toxin-antitoxin protein [Betaproteobacteria bacterium]
MNSATKLLDAMRSNPRDWQIEQLHTIARQHDMKVRSIGGSHQVFAHALIAEKLSVPAHRPIKPVYIRQFVVLVDKIKTAQAEKEAEK